MGLIAAALSSAGSVMADQWKEYFYCDSIPADVLALKAKKKTSGRSSNKGSDNIISNGSIIAVAEGQCMLIVEQGKIVDLCAEPGEYKYDISTEPSLLDGGKLGSNLLAVFANIGKRFTFGGEIPKDQRVYYFNTKEIMGNKYGTPAAVPFRVVDERAGIDIDISIRCFGEYSYRISDPMTFFVKVTGNITNEFRRSDIEGQLKSEFLTKLQPAFGRLSAMGIRYSALPGHTAELADALREELVREWKLERGIEVVKVGVSSVKADEEDEKMLKELQRNAAFTDPARAAAYMVGATGAAMQKAAENSAGAATGFMGMGMVGQMTGMNMGNVQGMYQMAQQNAQQAPAAPAADTWTCPTCGSKASGNFCPDCGTKKPAANSWTCSCGAVNKGKFCTNCGAKKPAGIPQYKCDKCGWEPADPTKPPRFCPECGDPFGDEDII